MKPLSEVLGGMLGDSQGPVSMDQTMSALGDRSFGATMVVLALPAIFMPPGVASLFGAALLLISLQLLLARPSPWLPARIRDLRLQRPAAERLFAKASPLLRRAELWLQPRWAGLQSPAHERVIAVAAGLLSVILMLPLPIAHTFAALAIIAFGAGLMAADGLALLVGWGLVAGAGLACAALAFATLAGLAHI
ncbi:MAG: exopolysaccharide biosynthesis protein [Phenylobacterium sp.]